jgi:hypothetical protein
MSGGAIRIGLLLAPVAVAAVALCAAAIDLRGRAAAAIAREDAARIASAGSSPFGRGSAESDSIEAPSWPALLEVLEPPGSASAAIVQSGSGNAVRFAAPGREAFAWVRRLEGCPWPEGAHLELRTAEGSCAPGDGGMVTVVFEPAPHGAMEGRR